MNNPTIKNNYFAQSLHRPVCDVDDRLASSVTAASKKSKYSSTTLFFGVRHTLITSSYIHKNNMNQVPNLPEQQQMIVTSCDDTDNDGHDDELSDAADSLNDDGDDNTLLHQKADDLLFDGNADDEDEAYVYRHLRSGMMETINVLPPPTPKPKDHSNGGRGSTLTSSTDASERPNEQKLQVLKPRNSDAVLSCPYCFHIVCMDCQRHTTYKNQYRAMFVMNILVRWDMPLQYSYENRCLEPYSMMQVAVPSIANRTSNLISEIDTDVTVSPRGPIVTVSSTAASKSNSSQPERDANYDTTIYYTVCCANCQTTVAALDMTDEVYHFSGCLASA